MKRLMAMAAGAAPMLGGCGNDAESQLAGCKGEVRNAVKATMAVVKEQIAKIKAPAPPPGTNVPKELADLTDKMAKEMEALPAMFEKRAMPAVEAEMATWKGRDGLTRCREAVTEGKADLEKIETQGLTGLPKP